MKQTRDKKPQESNITIELPADAVDILSNGKNAYIHMDGVVFRVIEESKYWKEISSQRIQLLEQVREWVEKQPIVNIFDENSDFVNKKDLLTELSKLERTK